MIRTYYPIKDRVFCVAFWPVSYVSAEGNRYHPAVRTLAGTYVWYNIRCATRKEATARAQKAIDDANEHLRSFTNQWNVQEA